MLSFRVKSDNHLRHKFFYLSEKFKTAPIFVQHTFMQTIAIKINNSAVEIVNTYKYLDSIIDDKLNSNENLEKVYKKAN